MKNIKVLVENLKGKYNTTDPFEICDKRNIKIMYAPLGTINGYYIQVPKHQMIFINENLDEQHSKYVCAHELGHAIMHKGLNTFFLQNNTLSIKGKFERQANKFAAELLIDDNLLAEYTGQAIEFISKSENIDKEFLELKFK